MDRGPANGKRHNLWTRESFVGGENFIKMEREKSSESSRSVFVCFLSCKYWPMLARNFSFSQERSARAKRRAVHKLIAKYLTSEFSACRSLWSNKLHHEESFQFKTFRMGAINYRRHNAINNFINKLTTNTTIRVTLFFPILHREKKINEENVYRLNGICFEGILVSVAMERATLNKHLGDWSSARRKIKSHQQRASEIMPIGVKFMQVSTFSCSVLLSSIPHQHNLLEFCNDFLVFPPFKASHRFVFMVSNREYLRTWIPSNPVQRPFPSKVSTAFRRIKMISMKAVLRRTTARMKPETQRKKRKKS